MDVPLDIKHVCHETNNAADQVDSSVADHAKELSMRAALILLQDILLIIFILGLYERLI